MLLTKSKTFIIGPVATLLGFVMNAIFMLLNGVFSIPNLGLCIILFTIVIYGLMTPLTIKQQKFAKLSARMNPEIQKIQKKYKGKQDQASMLKMNEETKAVYQKYGVSPSGSCVQLLIQMPILFALYQVIWNIPAYVTSVKEEFLPLVEKIINTTGAQELLSELAMKASVNFEKAGFTENTIVDVLYKCKPADWETLTTLFPDFSELILKTQETMDRMNLFLGLNISDSPFNIMMAGFKEGAILLAIGALLIPILSGLTQWLSVKISSAGADAANPNAVNPNDASGNMQNSMKMMNNIMPIMSVVFCFTLPAGLGIYWIISAVVRLVQQILVNKKLENIDVEEMVKKNLEKVNEKRKKEGLPPLSAHVPAAVAEPQKKAEVSEEDRQERQKKIDAATEYYNNKAAKPGSIAAKARMVEQYNEKNMKK